jgi:hypothetical protein
LLTPYSLQNVTLAMRRDIDGNSTMSGRPSHD